MRAFVTLAFFAILVVIRTSFVHSGFVIPLATGDR